MLALPILILISFKKKYKASLPARFFLKNNPPFHSSGIWFHACSLGEVNSLKPIISKLKEKNINITTVTKTGYNSAKQIAFANVRYLPFEIFLPFWIKKQKTLIVLEAELWPLLFIVSKFKKTKTILLNARISSNSYNSYKKISWFYKWLFANVDSVYAQTATDKSRLEELGAKNVCIGGNIKTLSKPKITKEYIKPKKNIIIMASSHENEEKLLLKNLTLKSNDMLIVAPRHPERFDGVNRLLVEFAQTKGLSYSKIDDGLTADIVLCDKMGELVNLFNIADTVLLCGSFVENIGGHNPLEPAFFGCKIVTGRYTFNQNALFSLVKNIEVCSAVELKKMDFEKIKSSEVLHVGDLDKLIKKLE